MADQLGAGLDLALRHLGGDRVGILDGDARKGDVQLGRLFALLLRGHQDVGGFFAVGVGEHEGFLEGRVLVLTFMPARLRGGRLAGHPVFASVCN